MTRRTLGFWLLALLPAMAVAASPPAGLPIAPPAQWDTYRVLSERNIFTRNRARPPSTHHVPTPAAPPAGSDGDRFVLTGVIQQGQDCVAFFEDTRTGKTTQASLGDPLGRGQLTAITLDAVHYACDGNTTKIVVGSNLTGAAVSVARPATATSATGVLPAAATTAATPAMAATTPPPAGPSQATAGTPGGAKDSSATSILERMRQRREQELNK